MTWGCSRRGGPRGAGPRPAMPATRPGPGPPTRDVGHDRGQGAHDPAPGGSPRWSPTDGRTARGHHPRRVPAPARRPTGRAGAGVLFSDPEGALQPHIQVLVNGRSLSSWPAPRPCWSTATTCCSCRPWGVGSRTRRAGLGGDGVTPTCVGGCAPPMRPARRRDVRQGGEAAVDLTAVGGAGDPLARLGPVSITASSSKISSLTFRSRPLMPPPVVLRPAGCATCRRCVLRCSCRPFRICSTRKEECSGEKAHRDHQTR